MKVSADPRNLNYWQKHFIDLPLTVELDGREVRNVVFADDEAGIVEAYAVSNGNDLAVCECGQRPVLQLLFGEVVILGARRA
ncbi:hypothetical protein HU675_0035385 [Bradyrhizobium septentrionale]|uniref:hypothetical protein n=1 Tax=Bradyrhizobium septentrionale TaxID=1404411 RepID=UPI001596EBFB|nr:hypothetical protein [Bradyrhizobium septentrionale]UGY23202.1 hypothetical protein HU675_0035385 [Bradyrhizobium septentrionale]